MKFIESGPDIPDELLLALDEGRVVFFCGAGVSRAKANLPEFFGLAGQVRTTLGDLDDSSAAKILTKAHETGLISADRVFGLLERDFLERDIERAVAKALAPQKGVDLWAHEVLLDLATTKDGVTKLVTTNFDRLFDDCGRALKAWQPPKLPEPASPGEMNGIVYLHGRATADYDGAEGDGFILSSAEFGRAYLAEGWATRFFKDVIDRYSVVFVGYSADDPPVQYLLEALSKSNGRLGEAYAFQSGDTDDAVSRWRHKGVSAIPYGSKDGHAALWDTLKEWAERAKDPEGWQKRIIAMARGGPESLAPFQREQVAHLVSTKDGARKFRESDPPAPATWLCVFDPSIRYSNPDRDENGSEVNPFALYGLAGDDVPAPIHPDDYNVKRKTPSTAWDAFALNRRDRLELRDEHVTPLRGDASLYAGRLPDRINYLGEWIAKISNQNAAVWWGVRQSGLHKDIQKQIRWSLERSDTKCAPHILQSWHYLFEHWRAECNKDRRDWYDFSAEIKKSGWSKKNIRKYEELSRPRITVRQNFFQGIIPPQINEKSNLKDLMYIELKYKKSNLEISIPDECLANVVSALKRNLDIGIELEIECDFYGIIDIPSVIPSDDSDITSFERNRGLSGAVIFYTDLFERLLDLDVRKARQEAETWPTDDNIVFDRLRIWASRFQTLVPNEDFDEFFGRVSREAFWKGQHQRDLLHTLKERWTTLPVDTTTRIEERILEGRERWKNETEQDFVQRRAGDIADRLYWLHSKGCVLRINFEEEINRLKKDAPKWMPKHAMNADRSWEMRGGSVETNTDYSALLLVPLSKVLAKAQELSGENLQELVNYDPFRGLSTDHPVRALSALRLEAKGGEYPEWAWCGFLHSEKRKHDNGRFKKFIAEMFIPASDEALKGIIYPVSRWFLSVTDDLAEQCVPTFEPLAARLLGFLNDNPDAGNSGLVHGNRDPDWAAKALNSPAGNIAQTLYHDPRRKNLTEKQGFPAEWRILVEDSLALPGDNGRFALVFFCHLLNWFYYIDPEWTEENLLSVLKSNDTGTLEAWWSGYLWGVRELPSLELFQILKPHLLGKAAGQTFEEGSDRDKLASLVLDSWGHPDSRTGTEQISDNEFREILLEAGHHFRSRILWQLKLWSKENGEFWKPLRERFLRQVWPSQKVAKTPHDSARLIEFAFSDEERFVAVSDAILPLIDKIERDLFITLPPIGECEWNIVDAHPGRVLEILDRALPESANKWPYEIGAILERIVDADPSLRKDTRWVALSRRWNSR